MYFSIIFLPFINFFSNIIFGRFLGKKGSFILTLLTMFFTMLLSFFIFYEVVLSHSITIISLFNWVSSDLFFINWTFFFDSLTSTMLIVICSISALVHLYSYEYMSEDPHIIRFLSYLSLFTFFMLLLVTSGNFLQMFLGWEGVGLSSYLLINFWYTRIAANQAAMKALIMNRVGDFSLALSIVGVFFLFKSLDFSVVFSLTPFVYHFTFNFFNFELNILNVIVFLLFGGATAKSAQIGLHTWLPDAMEGPTPVSALIHAATMVTAGVFILLRCSPLLEFSSFILIIITIIGSITAFMAASIGVFQNDLKKVIAYSTCSQLGYMVFSCGLSNYSVSLFHLMNHAFFKALLFLSAGSVIHALFDEQDMRKMGGLINLMPLTYIMVLIGSLSLMGFPFLTGFYSKDLILELSYGCFKMESSFAFWLGTFSAFLTSFYSIRLIILTFINNTNNYKKNMEKVHEPSYIMVLPLLVLCIGSIFVGYIFKDLYVGLGTDTWLNCLFIFSNNIVYFNAEFLPFWIKLLPVIFSFLGFLLSIFIYNLFRNYFNNLSYYYKFYFFNSFFINKWYFDNIYNNYLVRFLFFFGYTISFKFLDRGFVELWGPLGIVRVFRNFSKHIHLLQSGLIYHYIFFMLIGILFFSFFYIFNFFILMNFNFLLILVFSFLYLVYFNFLRK